MLQALLVVVPPVFTDEGLGSFFEMFLPFTGSPVHYELSSQDFLCCVPLGLDCFVFFFICFHKLFDFFLVSLLTHSLFIIMLFNLHEFECLWGFSLRLVFSFRPLWSEKMLHMISIFLNLLRLLFVSYHMVNLKMFHVHFASLGWQVLHMCFKSISSSASFSATISLLILCSEDRSIVDSGLFQTP